MYPLALKIKMNKREFLHSTPNDIQLRVEIANEEKEEKVRFMEHQSWLNGLYVQRAILSAVDGKKNKYPEDPVKTHVKDTKQIAKGSGKTEEQLSQELAYATLLVKQANANISKRRKVLKESNVGE